MDLKGRLEHGGFGIAMTVVAAVAVALIRRGVKLKIEAEIPASKTLTRCLDFRALIRSGSCYKCANCGTTSGCA